MGGWLNPSILFIMIRNLITATLIASMPLNTNNTLGTANRYIQYSNTYEEAEYTNEELEYSRLYRTVDYTTARLGTQFEIYARGIQFLSKTIPEKEYILKQNIVITYNNVQPINLNYITYYLNMNVPNSDKLSSAAYEWYIYNEELNQYADELINGANYNNYTEIRNAYQHIDDDTIYQAPLNTTGSRPKLISNNDKILVKITLEYDGDLINDNGAFMNYSYPLNTISEDVNYVLPDVTNYEVVDIPGLMFTVLGMPFAWISIAFNFTIFPGTPYALNISHLVLAVIVAGIAIFIIKKILK